MTVHSRAAVAGLIIVVGLMVSGCDDRNGSSPVEGPAPKVLETTAASSTGVNPGDVQTPSLDVAGRSQGESQSDRELPDRSSETTGPGEIQGVVVAPDLGTSSEETGPGEIPGVSAPPTPLPETPPTTTDAQPEPDVQE